MLVKDSNDKNIKICDFCSAPSSYLYDSRELKLSKQDYDICEPCFILKTRRHLYEQDHRMRRWEEDIKKETGIHYEDVT